MKTSAPLSTVPTGRAGNVGTVSARNSLDNGRACYMPGCDKRQTACLVNDLGNITWQSLIGN